MNAMPPLPALSPDAAELEARFATVETAARIGYWRQKAGEARQSWSPGLYALFGFEPGSVESTAAWLIDRIHPDDRQKVVDAIAKAIETKNPFYYRTRGLSPNGAIRHFDTYGHVQFDANGGVAELLGVVQDVSEVVAAQDAVKASEENYRFLAEESSDIITRHASSGHFLFVSPAVSRVLGIDPDAYMGSSPWERTHPDDLEPVHQALNLAKRTGEAVTYSFRAKHAKGHWVWMESTTRYIFEGPARTVKGAISVSRDIAERKRVEEELLRQREQAEMASQTKTRFLANMSHELRTPLNAIIGFSDILNKELFGPLGSERYLDYAQLINESGALLLDLINDLLDMSKIESGKFELRYEDTAAAELASACVRIVSRRAEEKGLSINVTLEPERFLFQADQRAMKQIVLNLLTNAVKFTSKGEVGLSMSLDGDRVKIVVSDTGIGIPAHILPKLGQPFEQANTEASRQQSGSGLGLALVKSLAQLHGGSMTLESVEGEGTTVTVTLPATQAAAASMAA
jgi:two-component system, cell cycle sensor histidine kinase PleC